MKLAPLSFKKNGFSYNQVKRAGAVALYSVNSGKKVLGYEVHRIRSRLAARSWDYAKLGGHSSYEVLAGNEDFGTYGWYYQDRVDAEDKYDKVLLGNFKRK